MRNKYFTVTSVISDLFLLAAILQLVVFIQTTKNTELENSPLAYAVVRAVSLGSVDDGFTLFCSVGLLSSMGILGKNIKNGTGAPGGCFVMGCIFGFIKFCDLAVCLLTNTTLSVEFFSAAIFITLIIIFNFCCVKQWDSH